MDPVSAFALAQGCLQLVATTASTAKTISELISRLKTAEKSITLLASQIDLIHFVLSELQAWLDRDPPMSHTGKVKLDKAIQSCHVIVMEISNSVQRVRPLPGELGPTLSQRVRLVWSEEAIREQRDMISTSLQTFQLIINLTSL